MVINNYGTKTLIEEYDSKETFEIKEEVSQDQETHQRGDHNVHLEINQFDENCLSMEVSCDDNSSTKTLVEYDYDETLEIKEEIIEDQERHQSRDHNLLFQNNQLEEKCSSSDINSFVKVLICCEYDQTLEIKEETIQDQESTGQELNKKNESKLCTSETREADKKKIHEPKQNPEKKYKCEKCTGRHTSEYGLKIHQKLVCGVTPQFICEFCGNRFKREHNMIRHVDLMHHKINSKQKIQESSQKAAIEYKCGKCARSYKRNGHLKRHQNFECGIMPQFSCELCGNRFKFKSDMNRHVSQVHLKNNLNTSKTKYNCDQCSRSYNFLRSLTRHKRSKHVAVQYICDVCGHKANQKCNLAKHITARHLM